MEAIFKNNTPLDADTMFELNWFYISLNARGTALKRVASSVCAVILCGASVLWAVKSGAWTLCVPVFLAGALIGAVPFIQKMRAKSQFKRNLKGKFDIGYMNEFTFCRSDFSVRNSQSSVSSDYRAVKRWYETGRYFFLFIDEKKAFMIDKRRFTKGSARDFRAFLHEKCADAYRGGKPSTRPKKA